MYRALIILTFLLAATGSYSQVSFKTIVPQQAVVAGESFQVQYIIEEEKNTSPVNPPVFDNFRFVSGPNIYSGTVAGAGGKKPVRNVVYTLEALRPGKFIIPGATITTGGRSFRSNNALVEVISKEEAIRRYNKENNITASDYFLRPGENAYEKINRNLFVKVMVDRKTCFVGEPVLATFKLYSRLESKSDIVKNPGFYGFTVYDMVNLADKQVITENVNGQPFDVHTIRKVQLYPLQAGVFTVDAMEVKNKVEFSRSAVNKKTEQEIIEGVLGNNDNATTAAGTAVFETAIETEPVTIRVNAAPEKNKPAAFNGATGNFTIFSSVIKNHLKKNEEGFFEVTVSGKGNFIQLSAPAVQWPSGIEGFDPVVKDTFDKTKVPLAGTRTFRYPFVSSRPGSYTIPSIPFAFLNTDTGGYKVLEAPAVGISISNEEKAAAKLESSGPVPEGNATKKWIVAAAIVMLFVIALIWVKRRRAAAGQVVLPGAVIVNLSGQEALAPVYQQLEAPNPLFYAELQQAIWRFFNYHFNLSGSEMKKDILVSRLNNRGADSKLPEQLQEILEECEVGIFTGASPGKDRNELLQQTKQIMDEVNHRSATGSLF